MASGSKNIVTVSFSTSGSSTPQEIIEQTNEFISQNMPSGWQLVNLNVRDQSYASEALHALTSSN